VALVKQVLTEPDMSEVKVYEPGQPRQAVMLLGAVVAALGLAFGGPAAYHHLRQVAAQRELSAARLSMTHITVPAEYQQFSDGCSWYRCYLINEPSTTVATTVKAVFHSTGATPAHPLKQFPQLPVFGCETSMKPEGSTATCTLTGWVHGQPVVLFMHPYFGGTAHRDWHWTRSEVDISFKPDSPGGR
jgi:hypothetical protein